ncbi:MAG: ribonuclease Z [Prolixibacteraceae bacterium]|jgi:ribonuclease Z|nr:ribonuclease Z [Prolixibacteraceae bacterium]
MIPFELTILGTSSALPTSSRYPTAHVLNVRERFFLIDCGEGTQIQLRKYGVKYARINHIFISHLHGDHYFGLIGLLSTYALLGRSSDLHIYAHSELPDLLKLQLDFINDDSGFNIIWHPLNFKRKQVIIENEIFKVTSFPVKHRIPCCGFIFEEQAAELNIRKDRIEKYNIPIRAIHLIKKGNDYTLENGTIILNKELTFPKFKQRSYAFCTDTSYLPELKDTLMNVDLLYHEATYDKTMEKQAKKTFHSTTVQAASLAKLSNAGKLLIGHFSARYKNTNFLVDEACEIFEHTIAANEGMIQSIPQMRVSE